MLTPQNLPLRAAKLTFLLSPPISFAAEAVEQVQSLQRSFPDIYRCRHREGGLQERPPGHPR